MRRRQRPSPSFYATEPQCVYLRRLLDECFAKRVEHGTGLDRHHLSERLTRAEASAAIDKLRGALDAAKRARAEQILTAQPIGGAR